MALVAEPQGLTLRATLLGRAKTGTNKGNSKISIIKEFQN